MPVATIHLLSLANPSTLPALLKHITASPVTPLTISKPIRWIIRPEHIDASALLSPQWDLLLILEESPASQDLIRSILAAFSPTAHWQTRVGIPSRLTRNFHSATNAGLLHPDPKDVPALTGALDDPLLQSSGQDLSLSHELRSWIGASPATLPVSGAVSMLNLLAFKPGLKASYLKYGAAFAESIGAKRGGNAKLVGNVIPAAGAEKEVDGVWHEFALAHYPSLLHFADMLASKDYQEVNQKHRVGSLADTCILCTSELEVEEILKAQEAKAKL